MKNTAFSEKSILKRILTKGFYDSDSILSMAYPLWSQYEYGIIDKRIRKSPVMWCYSTPTPSTLEEEGG